MRICIDVRFLLRESGKGARPFLSCTSSPEATKSLPSGPNISIKAETSSFLTARIMASAACCGVSNVSCGGCGATEAAAFVCEIPCGLAATMQAAMPSAIEKIFVVSRFTFVDFMYFPLFMS